jgi:hypothetical protein
MITFKTALFPSLPSVASSLSAALDSWLVRNGCSCTSEVLNELSIVMCASERREGIQEKPIRKCEINYRPWREGGRVTQSGEKGTQSLHMRRNDPLDASGDDCMRHSFNQYRRAYTAHDIVRL